MKLALKRAVLPVCRAVLKRAQALQHSFVCRTHAEYNTCLIRYKARLLDLPNGSCVRVHIPGLPALCHHTFERPLRGLFFFVEEAMIGYSSSVESSSSFEKLSVLHAEPRGTQKIHYNASSDWDFILETQEAIDMSLAIPHYRARHQPVDHRLNMFVGADIAPVKVQVCRPVPRCKFHLEIRAEMSNVTVWLPSDFRGHIRYSGQASFSAGFVDRMMANVRLNEDTYDQWDGDEVLVQTKGTVTFRMWDAHTNAAEKTHKGTWKRMFGGSKKTEDVTVPHSINWDFLLDG